MHRAGTARQPVNGLATCENPEGEHLIVAKGRSSPSDSPFLAPLSKHCGMVKSFIQMELIRRDKSQGVYGVGIDVLR